MYVEDVDSRKPKETEQEEEETVEPESAHGIVQLLKEMERRLTADMKEGFDKVKSEIDGLEKKVSCLGEKVKDLEDEAGRGGSRESGWDFNFPSERDKRVEVTGDKGKEKVLEEGEKEGEEGEKTEEGEKEGEEGEKEGEKTEEEEKGGEGEEKVLEEGEKTEGEKEGEEGEKEGEKTGEEEKGGEGEEKVLEEGEKTEEETMALTLFTGDVTEIETEEETMALTLFTGEVTYPPVINELEASDEEAKPKKKQKTNVREKKPSQFKKPPYTADGKRRTTRKAVGTKRKNTGDGARKSPRKKTKN